MGRGSSKASGSRSGGTATGRSQYAPSGAARDARIARGVTEEYRTALDRHRQAALMDDMNDEYSEAIAFASDGYYPDGELMDQGAIDLNTIVASGLLGDDYASGREYRNAVSDVLGGLDQGQLSYVQSSLRDTSVDFRNRAANATGRLREYYEDMSVLSNFASDKMSDVFGESGARRRRR